MRKGSKKATASSASGENEDAVAAKGAARETELRTLASRHGAVRARLVLKLRCGTIEASERVTLLAAHVDFGVVKLEQGHEAHAEEIFHDALNLTRDLLRRGETMESLQSIVDRMPKDLRRTLIPPPVLAAAVNLEESIVPRPRAMRAINPVTPQKVALTPRAPRPPKAGIAAVVADAAVVRRGRPRKYSV